MYADCQYEAVWRKGDLLQGHSNQSAGIALALLVIACGTGIYAAMDYGAVQKMVAGRPQRVFVGHVQREGTYWALGIVAKCIDS